MLTVVVLFAGIITRAINLSFPGGLSIVEANLLTYGTRAVMSAEWYRLLEPTQPLFSLVLGASYKVFGSVLLLRILLTALGVLAAWLFYLFCSSWFNKQVSLVATLFFSLNAEFIIYSRLLNPTLVVILLQLTILLLLTKSFRENRLSLCVLGSGLIFLGILLDLSFLFTGTFILLSAIAAFLARPKFFVAYWKHLIVLVLPSIISVGIYVSLYGQILLKIASDTLPKSFAGFYLAIGGNLLSIFYHSSYTSSSLVSFEPLLDPLVAITAICGIILVAFRFEKRKHKFLLIWFLGSLLIASSLGLYSTNYLIYCLLPLMILSALSIDYLMTSWVRTFPYDQAAKFLMTVAFSIFLFLSVYYNYVKFADGWLNNASTAKYYSESVEVKK